DHASAETAYGKALDAAPSLKLAKLGRELSRQRMMAGLKSGAKRAAEGDEAGAKTLAELLKKDPKDKEANAALTSILDKARSLAMDPDGADARKAFSELVDEAKRQADAGNDRQAGALLDAANVVSKPETARKAIEDANKLVADGKHAEAEAAYTKVLSGGESK